MLLALWQRMTTWSPWSYSVALVARPHCGSSLRGLFFGGGHEAWRLLGVQSLGVLCLTCFAAISTYIVVVLLELMCGFRVDRATELIGLDYMEHAYDDGRICYEKDKIRENSPCVDTVVGRLKRSFSSQSLPTLSPQDSATSPSGQDDIPFAELRKEVLELHEEIDTLRIVIHFGIPNKTSVMLEQCLSEGTGFNVMREQSLSKDTGFRVHRGAARKNSVF